ncbi:DHHC palmitoyltransferase-domain-containing protein [Phascolomyces articulosus]|uniref:Palmitoyltransferase n=1 Tax=Phascolomyces articulosus TaxID=60185 RepID=A0AAD5PDR2_9FUNG|nr:DHHC palmitoyltransferase-domain-containing protein [Phascolomyces articulosus]
MSRSIETIAARITFPCVVYGLMSYTLHSFIVRVYGRLLASHDVRLLGSPSCTLQTTKDKDIIQVSLCNKEGEFNICSICNITKPDRTHHCKQCNQCILKMDHHCPWIGGCVGQQNHKLFYLFLLYTTTYACWVMSIVWSPLTRAIFNGQPISLRFCWNAYKLYLYTLYKIGINFYHMGRYQSWVPLLTGVIGWDDYQYIDIHWVVTLLLGILFSVVLSGFTGFHSYCILRNKTTIEHVSSRPYHLRIDYPDDSHYHDDDEDQVAPSLPITTTTTTRSRMMTFEASERLWDNGIKNNWNSVMGISPWFWFGMNESNKTTPTSFSPQVYDRIIQHTIHTTTKSSEI